MRVFHCEHCGQLLFFENVMCVRCGHALAYVPELAELTSLDRLDRVDGPTPLWRSPRSGRTFRLCENYTKHDVCNWALPSDDPNVLCRACRLTKVIPNLADPANKRLWYKLEVAKRRLLYTIDHLRLPLGDSLAFEFLEDVLTGHKGGVITVNLAEADDAERVKRRVALNEPYRTLLGHLRHESGHYYWSLLVDGSDRVEAFRALFGDERVDYDAALKQHYDHGGTSWQEGYVSAYARVHPWEDWAETWAHYLHMVDALETSAACGISIEPKRSDEPTLTKVPNPIASSTVSFEKMMDGWATITYVLNNLNRCLGNDDAYPFVLSPRSIEKLRFVHDTIDRGRAPSAQAIQP